MRLTAGCLVLTVLACPATAAVPELAFPRGTVETLARAAAPGSYDLPTGPYTLSAQPALALEGLVSRRAFRAPGDLSDTLGILQSLRDQLAQAGLEILLDCATEACGGFDFRMGVDVLPPPEMEFSLADFRQLSARDAETGTYLSLLVTRTARGVFIQADTIRPGTAPLSDLAPVEVVADQPQGALADALDREGHAVLDGISFASGSAEIEDSGAEVLAELAALLEARPGLDLLIVGHTDNQGDLAGNIAISRARARAVADALTGRFAIDGGRLDAEGAGYLAPRAPNATDEGRALNRRVEVVVR